MAANLVSIVTQFLTPDLIAKIASALGIDQNVAQKAITGSIPAILAGLTGVTSKPDGVKQLSDVATQQSSGVIDNLTKVLGGPGQKAITDSGSSLLSSLLGGGTLSALAAAIGRYAGISGPASNSLIGMLGPLVLGALGQQQKSAGLDASGLASLLTSQKDQIAAAIPSGLANHLGSSGLLDALDVGVRRGADAAGRMGSAAERTVVGAGQMARETASRGAGSGYWPLWAILGLAVLAGLGWYLFSGDTADRVAEQARQAPDQAGGTVGLATPSLMVGGINLANQVNGAVGSLRTNLTSITDASSAQAALPRIREAKAQLDRVSALAEQLPPDGRRALARLIAGAMPVINGLCDKALAMPGVASIAKPTIDDLRARLSSLAAA